MPFSSQRTQLYRSLHSPGDAKSTESRRERDPTLWVQALGKQAFEDQKNYAFPSHCHASADTTCKDLHDTELQHAPQSGLGQRKRGHGMFQAQQNIHCRAVWKPVERLPIQPRNLVLNNWLDRSAMTRI